MREHCLIFTRKYHHHLNRALFNQKILFLFLEFEELGDIKTEPTTDNHLVIGFGCGLFGLKFFHKILGFFLEFIIFRLVAFIIIQGILLD